MKVSYINGSLITSDLLLIIMASGNFVIRCDDVHSYGAYCRSLVCFKCLDFEAGTEFKKSIEKFRDLETLFEEVF